MFKSFNTTGIGSLPHTDPVEACNLVLDSVDVPFWPQLPHRSFLEQMVPQYSEGFPFVKIEGEHVNVVQGEEAATAAFYETVADNSGFPISQDYAAGLSAFIDTLTQKKSKFGVVKGHITGPLTYTLSIVDEQKRPIYFNDELRELSLELLKGKAGWQIDRLKPFAEKVLIFIDEPILTALGTSTYIGVNTEEASRLLVETVKHIQSCGGIAGIHCCGKADWPLVLSSGVDVFNFDAYDFGETLSLYPGDIKSFLDNRGYIAWGIVPTTDAIKETNLQDLKERLDRALSSLENIGIPGDQLRQQSLITPSCGTGSLNVEDTLKVFSLLKELKTIYVKG